MLQNMNDYHLCLVFSITLTELAQKWCQLGIFVRSRISINLPSSPRINLFLLHLLNSCPLIFKKIKQYRGESLRDYIARFNTEAIQVKILNRETVCEALKKETRNIKFLDLLIKNPAADYYQLMQRAQKYIKSDDKQQAFREERRSK
ncbi:hypothetical protein P3X46_034590 [Hevea brasiliensis]|uniref:Retrotransposon gag domain-containing protein n=1 Tax=Hevea brasiliensis TaxID=3981 RepID=A0ABQ9K7P7_HEVBR|nr:hypothetical protein P3X46_034590 [Hevea brasiliensis]